MKTPSGRAPEGVTLRTPLGPRVTHDRAKHRNPAVVQREMKKRPGEANPRRSTGWLPTQSETPIGRLPRIDILVSLLKRNCPRRSTTGGRPQHSPPYGRGWEITPSQRAIQEHSRIS